jgi:hypothetical protein
MLLFVTGLALFGWLASAGKLLWDGRFNGMASSAELGKCESPIVEHQSPLNLAFDLSELWFDAVDLEILLVADSFSVSSISLRIYVKDVSN